MTPYKVPVYSAADGQVSITWNKLYMELGALVQNQGPLTKEQKRVFRTFLDWANSDELQFRFTLKPGQIIWFNNLTHLHARTKFEDFDDPDLRRHLLRLWLRNPDLRARAKTMSIYDGSATKGITKQEGKKPSFDYGEIYERFAPPL